MKKSTLIEQYKSTLLGRIKLNIAFLITGKSNTLPTGKQSAKYWKEQTKNRPSFWSFFLHSIIVDTKSYPISYSKLINSKLDIKIAFNSLAKNFTENVANFTILDCPAPFPDKLIAWIVKDNYQGQKSPEFAIIIGDEDAPKLVLIALIISIDEKGEIVIEEKMEFGYDYTSNTKWTKDMVIKLALSSFIACDVFAPFDLISIESLRGIDREFDAQKYMPPEDSKLMKYIYEVRNGERNCIKAVVNLSDLRLFDLDFGYSIPEQVIMSTMTNYNKIAEYGLLTYEINGKLVVSDDYISYLSFRVNDLESINVVNLGEFEKVCPIKVLEKGGVELFPPMVVTPSEINVSESFKFERLEEKIKIIRKLKKISESLIEDFESIKEMIGQNKLDDAINEIMNISIDPKMKNDIFLVKGRYDKLKQDITIGVIEKDKELVELARIRQSCLSLLSEI